IHEAVAVYALHNAPPHISNIAYLPLAHIAERELSIYMPVVHAGHVHTLADPGDIASALSRVRPDSLFGVPRVWEKMVAGMKSMRTGVPDDRREPCWPPTNCYKRATNCVARAKRYRRSWRTASRKPTAPCSPPSGRCGAWTD